MDIIFGWFDWIDQLIGRGMVLVLAVIGYKVLKSKSVSSAIPVIAIGLIAVLFLVAGPAIINWIRITGSELFGGG